MTKTVKLLGISLLFMLAASISYGQKCKYDYEKNDAFTGEHSKGNSFKINRFWYLGLNKLGDNYHVGLHIQLNGTKNLYLEKGDSLMFKMANGESVILYSRDRYAPQEQAYATTSSVGITSTYRAIYDISIEDLYLLKTSLITHVRLNISSLGYQTEIKEKEAKKFQQNADCIMQK
jgi:hypothetical protein